MKNIREPYISLLIPLLPAAVAEAYRQIRDAEVRRNFARTLETWWNILPVEIVRGMQQRVVAIGEPSRKRPEPVVALLAGRERRPHVQATSFDMPMPPYYGQAQTVTSLPSYIPTYPLSERLISLLSDLRAAMDISRVKYNASFVADLMERVQITLLFGNPNRLSPLFCRLTGNVLTIHCSLGHWMSVPFYQINILLCN